MSAERGTRSSERLSSPLRAPRSEFRMSRLRLYAQLMRLPNVFTAFADIGLGARVTRRAAARLGTGLLGAGLGFAALGGWRAEGPDWTPLFIALSIAVAVLLY